MARALSRADLLREIRNMSFEEAQEGWREIRLTQVDAGQVPGMSERNFRRYLLRYECEGLQGLIDRRVEQVSSRPRRWQTCVVKVGARTSRTIRRCGTWQGANQSAKEVNARSLGSNRWPQVGG